ncbi:MAG TPA: alpha/beta hydrolase [Streptosporangiales bacterium]
MLSATAGAARLHCEIRGSGPGLVFVPGGLVDSAHFAELATLLADGFTTVSYDRRGSAGSPRPPSWHATSIGEQADDLAAVIEDLGLAPCAVWGGSLGGIVLLELLARRPGLVRAAIVQEPPLFTVLPGGEAVAGRLGAAAAAAVRDGSTAAAFEEHARTALGATYDLVPTHLRERMAANAELFFGIEVPALLRSMPSPDDIRRTLARAAVTVHCLASVEDPQSPPHRATRWLADELGIGLTTIPGGHMPYVTEPAVTAATVRELLTTRERP